MKRKSLTGAALVGIAFLVAVVAHYAHGSNWSATITAAMKEMIEKRQGKPAIIRPVKRKIAAVTDGTFLALGGYKISFIIPPKLHGLAITSMPDDVALVWFAEKQQQPAGPRIVIDLTLYRKSHAFAEHLGVGLEDVGKIIAKEDRVRHKRYAIAFLHDNSDEKLFLTAVSHTRESMAKAGKDDRKAMVAYACLRFQHDLETATEFEKVTAGQNTIYIEALEDKQRPPARKRKRLWVFKASGAILAEIVVEKAFLDDALIIASSLARKG